MPRRFRPSGREAIPDTRCGTEGNYEYLMMAGILPSIPRHTAGSKQAIPYQEFVYDSERDDLVCPGYRDFNHGLID
jgi:hypothetical protein